MIEAFPYSDFGEEIPAIRVGPDRLPLTVFDRSPWPIQWVAYWYRNHLWCRDPRCRCSDSPRAGDGLCAIGYADGYIGYYDLQHTWRADLLNWEGLAEAADRGGLATAVDGTGERCPVLDCTGENPGSEAATAVRDAIGQVRRLGW